ncbi:MAG: hypothetical protein Q8O56_09580 [Solirubrobacteraceae bacterium]|nr:hypothetical protein [Solirubrobacteraceae bacterium]
MRRAPLPLVVVLVVLLAGCGNDRTPVTNLGVIPAPKAFRDAIFADEGIRFRAPTNWRIIPGQAPQVATVAIGNAQVGIWRYPRSEPLPETRSQLDAARQALVAQIESRDPTFKLTSTRLVIKPGLRAVEVVGTGTNLTNASVQREMRSLHAYGHGAEVVMDAFAPPRDFARVDEQSFAPMARSLQLRAPSGR